MFVCGDDEAGKSIVLKLTEEVGFEAINAGKLSSARLLEPTPCFGLSSLPPTVRTQLRFCHSAKLKVGALTTKENMLWNMHLD